MEVVVIAYILVYINNIDQPPTVVRVSTMQNCIISERNTPGFSNRIDKQYVLIYGHRHEHSYFENIASYSE